MPALKDLTGMRFGKLIVLCRSGQKQRGSVLWHVLCDCGKEIDVIGNNLRNGNTRSCGCLKSDHSAHNFIDRTGHRYGMLMVINREKSRPDRHTAWRCRCDCGEETVVSGSNLSTGVTKSCGCLKHKTSGRRKSESENPVVRKNGYVCIRGYNRDGKWTERPQHIVVMERSIGRKLKEGETVHHKNGIRNDNRISNLELWSRSHLPGQRVTDMIDFCIEYLTEYAPEYLAFIKETQCG